MGDTLRWFGTMAFAFVLAAIALWFTGQIASAGRDVPQVLVAFDGLAGGAFFGIVGAMAGARATQNGSSIAMGAGVIHP